ncbi:MAG: DUF58 domain-containing protein, partial [Geminicoccaceae bacterium]|nr:DUF58 domain-containing protein [Geminicoccaceae bacterium]
GRRRVGIGETFWQFRPYQGGDPTQRIDWRQSARSAQVFLREQEWEAAESVWLWCDTSSSMHYRSSRDLETKLERTVLLTLALAALLTRAGERVGLLGSQRRAAGGRVALDRLVQDIGSHLHGESSLPPPEALPRYARLVLISDFFTAPDELRERLRSFLAMGVRGHLLQVLDPAEPALPFAGRIRFEGVEREGSALIGKVEDVRGRYQNRLEAHRLALRGLARQLGWTFAGHTSDHPVEPAVLALYTALGTSMRR